MRIYLQSTYLHFSFAHSVKIYYCSFSRFRLQWVKDSTWMGIKLFTPGLNFRLPKKIAVVNSRQNRKHVKTLNKCIFTPIPLLYITQLGNAETLTFQHSYCIEGWKKSDIVQIKKNVWIHLVWFFLCGLFVSAVLAFPTGMRPRSLGVRSIPDPGLLIPRTPVGLTVDCNGNIWFFHLAGCLLWPTFPGAIDEMWLFVQSIICFVGTYAVNTLNCRSNGL